MGYQTQPRLIMSAKVAIAAVIVAQLLLASYALLLPQQELPLLDDAGDNLTSYSIQFIDGGNNPGNIIMAQGLVLPQEDTFHSFFTDKKCTCRMACWAHLSCQGFSAQPVEGTFHCRLTMKNPTNIAFKDQANSSFFFKTDSIQHYSYKMHSDHFLYLIPNVRKNWQDAKNFCAKIPGHRLGIFQTVEMYNSLFKMYNEIVQPLWVDLTTINGNPTWGNGLALPDTPAATVIQWFGNNGENAKFIMHIQKLVDYPATNLYKVVCQANPLELDW